jgi:hypothetical protein
MKRQVGRRSNDTANPSEGFSPNALFSASDCFEGPKCIRALESSRAGFVRFERIERPAPPILEIEDRHAEQKHWIVFWSSPAKYLSAFAANFLK